MKTRTALGLILMLCLLLAVALPAHADVRLPSGLIEIESEAFKDAAWLKGACQIPDGVTSIGTQAFYNCSGLTSLTIPDSVTSIGSRAFSGCTGLTGTITLPEGVTIADDAFDNCPGLTVLSASQATDPAELFQWSVADGEVAITRYIGDRNVTSVTVPAHIDGLPVTAIADSAFTSSRYLTSVSLPSTIETIGSYAFGYCSRLEELTMPDTVTSIDSYAFYYCSSLHSTIQLIGTEIASNAFTGCKSVTVMNFSVREDGMLSLSRMYGGVKNVKVPASVAGRLVTEIGREAFSTRTSLQTVELPQTVTVIGQSAFYYCSALQYIILPEHVTSIGPSAFYNCSALESVNFPESITSIGSMAFYNCKSLYDTLCFVDAAISFSSFSDCGDVEVWCFTSKADGSLELLSCRSYRAEVSMPSSVRGRTVTSMASQAFSACNSVKSVIIPQTIRAISEEAFMNCKALESVALPSGLISIESKAFSGCTALESVHIPATVTRVGKHAFYGCSGMTSLTVESNSTVLSEYAFANCTGLVNINLPSGFDNVGNFALNGTPWLRNQFTQIALSVCADCTTDYDRALVLHDWLVNAIAYDTSMTYGGPEGVLFQKKGVCNAYAMTYAMLLDAVGISNMTVVGTATGYGGVTGSHAWTLVKLNGSWYHVDTTWDDPLPDHRERHTYFCLTDAQIAGDHFWNREDYPAADSTSSLTQAEKACEESVEAPAAEEQTDDPVTNKNVTDNRKDNRNKKR